jgi:ABC-type multidrug transport system permease subunit
MLIILSPTWFTVFQLPAALNTFVQIIPTYYLADLLNRSLSGNLAWSPVATDFGVLLGSLILTFGLVIWILRRQET